MKKSILVLTAVAALFLVSCKENPYIAGPGADDPRIPDSIPVLVPDTDGIVISIDSAITICNSLAVNAVTAEKYKLSGVVSKNGTAPTAVPGYTNINITIKNPETGKTIDCFYTNNLNNTPFRRSNQVPLVGSKITVLGPLTLYQKSGSSSTTPEVKEGFIVRIDSMVKAETVYATCAEAKAAAMLLPSGGNSTDIYVIEGYVQKSGYSDVISNKQQKFFWIDDVVDGAQTFEAYYCNVPDGKAVPIGAKVRLTGQIMNYSGTTAEMKNGNVVILEQPAAVE